MEREDIGDPDVTMGIGNQNVETSGNASPQMAERTMQTQEMLSQETSEFIHQQVHEAVREQMQGILKEEIKRMVQHEMKSFLRHNMNRNNIIDFSLPGSKEKLLHILHDHKNILAKSVENEARGKVIRVREQTSRKRKREDEMEFDALNTQIPIISTTEIPNSFEQLNGRMMKMEQALERTLKTAFPRVNALLTRLERHAPRVATRSLDSSYSLPSTSSEPSTSAAGVLSFSRSIRINVAEPSFDSLLLPSDAPGRTDALARDLLQAVRWEKTDDVRKLLAAGANANYSGTDGWSCLIWAAQNANASIISMLLEKGADFNATNSEGHSALHFASLNDYNGRCVSILIDAGADLDKRSNDGDTPLHFAALSANEAAASKLIAVGASKTIENSSGKTPYSILSGLQLYQLLQP